MLKIDSIFQRAQKQVLKMKITALKRITFGVLCLFGAVHLLATLASGTTLTLPLEFEIPFFDGAYQIKSESDLKGGFKAIRYNVRLAPPAAEVIEFYDSYFNANGWIPSFEICQRHWDIFADQSTETKPLMQQMYASWEHPHLDLKFVLWLKYDRASKDGAEAVTVDGRLQSKTGKLRLRCR